MQQLAVSPKMLGVLMRMIGEQKVMKDQPLMKTTRLSDPDRIKIAHNILIIKEDISKLHQSAQIKERIIPKL